tara:strand:+ start:617 stop:787 length:171 start_codon:yes stop_codon:yes gene_type:complete
MKEYDKIKATQADQLGSIDKIHPMKQVAIMSVIQILMLIGMGIVMLTIAMSLGASS